MVEELINWYQQTHTNYQSDNLPIEPDSKSALIELNSNMLKPIVSHFGKLQITYGFTSFQLLKYIKKYSPGHMAPELDQHASHELNSRNNRICKRDGVACDIVVAGYEDKMHIIAEYIINELPFDRLYFYGSDRPLHISFGPEHSRYLNVMLTKANGLRGIGKGAKKDKAIILLNESIKI